MSDDVSVFSYNPNSGALTAVSGSRFQTFLAGANSIAFDSNDGFIFVGSTSGRVAVMQVNSTNGVLTPVLNSPFAVPFAPAALAVIRPTWKFIRIKIKVEKSSLDSLQSPEALWGGLGRTQSRP